MMRSLSLTAVAILAAAPAFAQTSTPPQPQIPAGGTNQTQTRSTVPIQGQAQGQSLGGQASGVNDVLFAAAAADGGLTEVMISQLGSQKATDPELKRFSQLMIEEHTRMNGELKAMADRKGIAVPQAIDVRAQFCAESLAGLSGEEFDRCYAKAQLVIHMDSVAMFEAEAKRGMDGDVRALAIKSLSHIKEHLRMIKPIAMRYEKEKESDKEHTSLGAERPVR